MLLRYLENLGLSEGEAKIYLAALELGESTVARIAKKAGIGRTTAYPFLEGLEKKGLLSVGKRGKRASYLAEDPKRLRDHIAERGRLIERVLPELLSVANVVDRKPNIRYFENREGIFDIYRETLDYPKSEILMWMSDAGVWYDDESFWKDIYIPARIEKRIALRAILPLTEKTAVFGADNAQSLRQTRLDPAGGIESDIMLFGGRFVAVISFGEIIGLIIESAQFYNTLKAIFMVHWQTLARAKNTPTAPQDPEADLV